ncbi:MAG: electron transport complex subunit E [Actinobacteria bacterium]|nr:MAG: electron transport complex subunit E [Actinomycetota bacterium]
MQRLWRTFANGVLLENPLTRLMIGLCSALAISTRAESTLFLGVAATFVLVMSNVIISSIRKLIPDEVRIPVFIVIIASFVTIVDLTMRAYFPPVYARLGVWIPLIVVNCMILGRAEAFAYKNGLVPSIADGFGVGVGYTFILMVMGVFRELFGSGRIVMFERTLFSLGPGFEPPTLAILFPGAFLAFGFLIAILNVLEERWRS